MDFQRTRRKPGTPETGSDYRFEVLARYNGHTHMYRYPEADAFKATRMIKLHVEEGQLHPYAGLMLIALVRGNDVA
jgi:hypothetical protein